MLNRICCHIDSGTYIVHCIHTGTVTMNIHRMYAYWIMAMVIFACDFVFSQFCSAATPAPLLVRLLLWYLPCSCCRQLCVGVASSRHFAFQLHVHFLIVIRDFIFFVFIDSSTISIAMMAMHIYIYMSVCVCGVCQSMFVLFPFCAHFVLKWHSLNIPVWYALCISQIQSCASALPQFSLFRASRHSHTHPYIYICNSIVEKGTNR